MGKSKIRLEFTGFREMAENLDKLGGDLKKTTEKALIETHKTVTPKVAAAMQKHNTNYSGETMKSLRRNAKVVWHGMSAEIGVGFEINNGGMASIFLMYGTPRMQPDRNLYNSIYGAATKREIKAAQEKEFKQALSEVL